MSFAQGLRRLEGANRERERKRVEEEEEEEVKEEESELKDGVEGDKQLLAVVSHDSLFPSA